MLNHDDKFFSFTKKCSLVIIAPFERQVESRVWSDNDELEFSFLEKLRDKR